MPAFYNESRQLEVRSKYDVIVVGGGPSGVVAALAAARNGVHVLIIEKQIILGGLSTGGHVCLFEPLCDGHGRQVTGGIVEEMLWTSIRYSYNTLPEPWKAHVNAINDPAACEMTMDADIMPDRGRYCTLFNIPAFTLAMEELVRKENIDILYDTLFCDVVRKNNVVTGVIVEEASGRYVIECETMIDTSGASLVFYRAGADCAVNTNHLTYESYDTNFARMQKAITTNNVEKAIHWLVTGWNPVISDPEAAREYLGTSASDITQFVLQQHDMALKVLKEKNKTEPGYAMLSVPTVPGIRMIRRIQGRYTMSPKDVFKHMDDTIGAVSDWRRVGPLYEIPYRCMIVDGYDNILAAGRNISAENDSWDLMRCYPGAMSTGQAAGTAAAIAVKEHKSVHEINLQQLQQTLKKDGAILTI